MQGCIVEQETRVALRPERESAGSSPGIQMVEGWLARAGRGREGQGGAERQGLMTIKTHAA